MIEHVDVEVTEEVELEVEVICIEPEAILSY
jgi:hypothetical protein